MWYSSPMAGRPLGTEFVDRPALSDPLESFATGGFGIAEQIEGGISSRRGVDILFQYLVSLPIAQANVVDNDMAHEMRRWSICRKVHTRTAEL